MDYGYFHFIPRCLVFNSVNESITSTKRTTPPATATTAAAQTTKTPSWTRTPTAWTISAWSVWSAPAGIAWAVPERRRRHRRCWPRWGRCPRRRQCCGSCPPHPRCRIRAWAIFGSGSALIGEGGRCSSWVGWNSENIWNLKRHLESVNGRMPDKGTSFKKKKS